MDFISWDQVKRILSLEPPRNLAYSYEKKKSLFDIHAYHEGNINNLQLTSSYWLLL